MTKRLLNKASAFKLVRRSGLDSVSGTGHESGDEVWNLLNDEHEGEVGGLE